jgi:hypothetical protein
MLSASVKRSPSSARASHSAASKSPFCPERAAGKFRAKANERQSLIADNWLQSATCRRRGKFANRPSSTHLLDSALDALREGIQ